MINDDTRLTPAVTESFSKAINLYLAQQGELIDLIDHEQIDELISSVTEAIIPLIDREVELLKNVPSEESTWMVELANRAVEDNTQENGLPKYTSAQGYACAMSAIRRMNKYFPKKESSTKSDDTPKKTDQEKETILKNAKEVYDFLKPKFGKASAALQVATYVAEQYGIAFYYPDVLSPEEGENVIQSIIHKLED